MIEALAAVVLHAVVVSAGVGAVLFAGVAVTLRMVRLEAATRHAVWTIALCAAAAMPLGAIGVSALRAQRVDIAAGAPAVAPEGRPVLRPSAALDSGTERHGRDRSAGPAAGTRRGANVAGAVATAVVAAWSPRPNRLVALVLAGIWLTGVVVGLLNLALGLRRVSGLKARSLPLDAERAAELPWLTETALAREIYLRLSFEIETPVAVGFARPVILIPSELATQAGLPAIEGLVLHEHAHLRRYDDWTNLAQRVIERLFWFNPLVWIVGRRIALEREIAADDAVVAATGQPAQYAQSLWQLAREMRMPAHTVVAPGAFFTRKQISIRIEALLDRQPVPHRWGQAAAAAIALTAVGCTVAAAAAAPGIELPASTLSAAPPVGAAAIAWRAGVSSAASAAPAIRGGERRSQQPGVEPSFPLVWVRDFAQSIAAPIAHLTIKAAAERIAQQAAAARASAFAAHPAAAWASAAGATAQASAAAALAQAGAALKANVQDATPCADCDADWHADLPDGRTYRGSDLSNRNLRNVDWHGRTFLGTDLSGSDLRGARLNGARFVGSDLSNARLDGANLTDVVMSGTNVEGTSFRGAKTSGLRITGASLSGMDLRGLDLRSMASACSGCNFEGADLRNADLSGAHLVGANFAGANLRGADLHGAVLSGSTLESADLQGANLRGAALTGCNLDGANLHGADTHGAVFNGTSNAGAQ
jgi:uncharacterized protein YjbI with pentapeptide repeats/beta-lactamase regulating signal transducer with metallopeptidase domain